MKTLLQKLIPVLLAFISLNAVAVMRYVDLNNPSPTAPYTNWSVAAVTIQAAVDASEAGDEILVTNGVYQTGGRLASGTTTTNRVVIDKAVKARSVNGPAVTVIQGQKAAGGGNGTDAIRCVYLTSGAVLAGFTLTNGATVSGGSGGGVYCVSTSAGVTNCLLIGNSAASLGGGAYSGKLTNCTLISNSATEGGGAYSSYLVNSLLTSNSAALGGGSSQGSLYSCTLVGNSASNSGGGWSGNALSIIVNSIFYYNSAPSSPNCYFISDPQIFMGCCTTTLPSSSSGGFTNEPLFVDLAHNNLRLQSYSPCINAAWGNAPPGAVDLDGNPRSVGGWKDIGAYECQSSPLVDYYTWMVGYGLSPFPGTQNSDTDGDGASSWNEWVAGTIPTNALSVLCMVNATNSPTGAQVTWQSVATRNYWLERATNLGDVPLFQSLATNIAGASGTTTYTDTSATNGGPYFYRVGVQ